MKSPCDEPDAKRKRRESDNEACLDRKSQRVPAKRCEQERSAQRNAGEKKSGVELPAPARRRRPNPVTRREGADRREAEEDSRCNKAVQQV